VKKIQYHGKVYCATVDNHVMYVRRNGKPYWCGNTLMYWSPPNAIFEKTLLKLKDKLAKSGYVGYIDINCIANSKGIYPLEWTCFSDDTEILTKDGWKFLKNIKIGEIVATLNPRNHSLEYQNVTGTINKKYTGEMINICGAGDSHQAIDCLVTPDHQMYIKDRNGKFKFVRADKIPQGSKIKRACNFIGEEQKEYIIPEYIEHHYLGKHYKIHPIKHKEIKMSMEVWLKFLGIFLAEGSVGGRNHIVSIAQFDKKNEIKELLKNFPFKVIENKKGYQISSTQLVKHLKEYNFGKCNSKYVPSFVKNLSQKYIKIFLDAFRIGDGTIHKRTKQKSYFSTSKKMIDDIQELLLKCGIAGNILKRNCKGSKCTGLGYFRNHDLYCISERTSKIDYYADKKNIKKTFYDNYVHCVEVPNHIIYVRRKGKAFFCGNCRFGYPTISIQIEGVTSLLGEFLYKLAKKEQIELRVKKGFQIGVVVAVPPYPFKDKKEVNTYRNLSILFKKQNFEGVHLGDVKKIKGVWRIAGVCGYALIITGSGTTVEEARKQTYKRLKNIMLQNMYYRTDIGLKWSSDSDKLQTWGYLY